MNSNRPTARPPATNPFSTRNIRPEASPFLFPVGVDAASLIDRLRRSDWWGQIIGPHGSGKSTLVHALAVRMIEVGRRIDLHQLHPREDGAFVLRQHARGWDGGTQVVIDGYEQLGRLDRLWLRRRCRMRGAGLLVTSHDDAGLPDLWRTETTTDLARAIVARLLPAAYKSWITDSDISRAFSEHQGNLRETLLALYDAFEKQAESMRETQTAGRIQIACQDDVNAPG